MSGRGTENRFSFSFLLLLSVSGYLLSVLVTNSCFEISLGQSYCLTTLIENCYIFEMQLFNMNFFLQCRTDRIDIVKRTILPSCFIFFKFCKYM